MCEWGRVTVTPVSPQKTVYGANVIVFEGILAFANKELLKVLLPDAAGHPLQGAAQGQACSRVLQGGVGTVLGSGGLPRAGSPTACWHSTSVLEALGRQRWVLLLRGGTQLARLYNEHVGGAEGVFTPPSFPAPGHEGVCGHGL